ncbi:MAG: hypothetical protein J0H63_12655, partial [Rhizobiales bacterium]|nr:hypothetical protein [Hyphomicrobiales bacterium]
MPDDDNLGARIADLGEAVKIGVEPVARLAGLDDDEVRRRRVLVKLGGGGQSPGMDLDVGAGHAPVGGGSLDGGGDFRRFAEGLDGYARDRADIDRNR